MDFRKSAKKKKQQNFNEQHVRVANFCSGLQSLIFHAKSFIVSFVSCVCLYVVFMCLFLDFIVVFIIPLFIE